MTDDIADMVSKSLTRAWNLGQLYWQQADSDFASQHRKSDETQGKFEALIEETRSALSLPAPPAEQPNYTHADAADRDVMRQEPATVLPDGSAFFTGSLPLPKDHWLYAPRCAEWDDARDTTADTPHPILTHEVRDRVVDAVRYAVRGATMCGAEKDFDPDAIVQNAVYALCGPYGDCTSAASPTPPAEQQPNPTPRELDMAMSIRRIVSSARRNCEDGSNVLKLANEAWSYLVRQGLEGSPLRDAGIASDSTVEQQGEQKRITTYARQSAAHQVELTAMIEERDHRETIIDELCDCVLGQDRTEWSSNYYFEDAVAEVQERILELEERKACRDSNAPALPVTLAELRAKVEGLIGVPIGDTTTTMVDKADVLAEIDKLGGGT